MEKILQRLKKMAIKVEILNIICNFFNKKGHGFPHPNPLTLF
jgi:hypothetical protein